MVIGSLGYVVNDALIRLATDRGLDVYQALCLRSAAMTVAFAAVSRARRERITLALGAAACLTFREFATRRVSESIPASTVALVTAGALSIFMGSFGLVTGWRPITAEIVVILLGASACLVVGYVFTIQTVRVGDLSVSSPFRYTALLGAVVLGIIIFDETPDGLTIAGCLVILIAGLVSIRLDQTGQGLEAPAAP